MMDSIGMVHDHKIKWNAVFALNLVPNSENE